MTDTTNARSSSGGSLFRSAPLPEEPESAHSWPERAALLRAQSEALARLVREDLSRGRGFAFLVCSAGMTLAALLVPVLVADAATTAEGDGAEVAVAAVAACLLLAIIALPALLVLRSLRARGLRRSRLLRQWAAVDRGYDSEFPSGYGSQGSPHPRFFNAAAILILAFILAVVVLATSDADAFLMLPGLVVAAFFAWTTVRKYADRYSWSSRERVIRGRERRRHQHRKQISGTADVVRTGVRPGLLYVALFAPIAIVAVVFAITRPKNVIGLVVVGLMALAVLVVGFPFVALKRRRERAQVSQAVSGLAVSFSPGTPIHPIRYGLGACSERHVAEAPAAWDCGPPRAGVLAIGAGALHLRGADGSAIDFTFSDLDGIAYVVAPVTWLDPTLDLLLSSGDSIEVRTADAEEIAETLSRSGVRTLSA